MVQTIRLQGAVDSTVVGSDQFITNYARGQAVKVIPGSQIGLGGLNVRFGSNTDLGAGIIRFLNPISGNTDINVAAQSELAVYDVPNYLLKYLATGAPATDNIDNELGIDWQVDVNDESRLVLIKSAYRNDEVGFTSDWDQVEGDPADVTTGDDGTLTMTAAGESTLASYNLPNSSFQLALNWISGGVQTYGTIEFQSSAGTVYSLSARSVTNTWWYSFEDSVYQDSTIPVNQGNVDDMVTITYETGTWTVEIANTVGGAQVIPGQTVTPATFDAYDWQDGVICTINNADDTTGNPNLLDIDTATYNFAIRPVATSFNVRFLTSTSDLSDPTFAYDLGFSSSTERRSGRSEDAEIIANMRYGTPATAGGIMVNVEGITPLTSQDWAPSAVYRPSYVRVIHDSELNDFRLSRDFAEIWKYPLGQTMDINNLKVSFSSVSTGEVLKFVENPSVTLLIYDPEE